MQMESTKRRRIKSSLEWLSLIFPKMILSPKKYRLKFRYFFKVQNFQQTVQYVVEPCLDIWHAKFQVDICIFGKHNSPKTVSVDDAIFQTVILSMFRRRTEIKMTFLESLDQTGSETHIFSKKKWKFDLIWPRVDQTFLSLTCMESDRKMASIFFNYACKSDYKACAACPKKEFLILVTFRDLSWPVGTLYGIYAYRVSSLALWGYFCRVSSKNYWYCQR